MSTPCDCYKATTYWWQRSKLAEKELVIAIEMALEAFKNYAKDPLLDRSSEVKVRFEAILEELKRRGRG